MNLFDKILVVVVLVLVVGGIAVVKFLSDPNLYR